MSNCPVSHVRMHTHTSRRPHEFFLSCWIHRVCEPWHETNLTSNFLKLLFQQLRRNAHVALRIHDFWAPKPGTKIGGLVPLTTLPKPADQQRTYDPQTCMSERTYDLHSSSYDPSRSHLRPSNPHVRSAPTTFTAWNKNLEGHTYDP